MKVARNVTAAVALTVAVLALTGGTAVAASGSAPSVSGTVTSVNGDTTPGACGVSEMSGDFTIVTGGATPTTYDVQVTGSTLFVQKKFPAATFGNVCVGYVAGAIGVDTAYTVAATGVSVRVPTSTHVYGNVTAVNGSSNPAACGTAGARGKFTLSTLVNGSQVVETVHVMPYTKFVEKGAGATAATFGDLCVGAKADAIGPHLFDGSVLALKVKFHAPMRLHIKGMVASVNGATGTDTCGIADTAGSFVVNWTNSTGAIFSTTVDVQGTTPFSGASGVTSFENVCVGAKAAVIGNYSGTVLEAISVATYPVKA